MNHPNRSYFEKLPSFQYFKTSEEAKILVKTPDWLLAELGFDETSGGVLAVHHHAHAALPREIPACAVLKKLRRNGAAASPYVGGGP